MRINYLKYLFLVLLSIGMHIGLLSQTKIQVVKKSITKELNLSGSRTIEIKGEKAQIFIRPSMSNKVNVKISLLAKNPDRVKAEADVKYCNYAIIEKDGKISISNTFNLKGAYVEITSNLSAIIYLEIPDNCQLSINNIYGNIDIQKVNSTLKVTNDFGQLQFQDISGKISISTNYGDISGSDFYATCNIDAQKADIDLKNINNLCIIKNQYGKVQIGNINASITINAENTEIAILVNDLAKYSFELNTKNGKVYLPKSLSSKVLNSIYTCKNGNISINATTTNSSITLKQ